MYENDVPTHPHEDFDHCCRRVAPVVTPSPFFVFNYLELYQKCFGIGRFCTLQTDRNELQAWNCLGEHHDKAVARWGKCWEH